MNRVPKAIELIIFDCDGVLVDSEPISNRIMAAHVTRLGWPMDTAECMRQFKGGHMNQITQRISEHVGRDVGEDWLIDFGKDQLAALGKSVLPIPGVRQVIKMAIASRKKVCVASQARKRKMDVTLNVTNLMTYFEGRVFSAYDVPRPKPFPDLFLHAAKQLETAAENSLVIEDSAAGVKAALAAGMSVIGYDPEDTGILNIDPSVKTVTSMDMIRFD